VAAQNAWNKVLLFVHYIIVQYIARAAQGPSCNLGRVFIPLFFASSAATPQGFQRV
jgi:hypothetical protein